MIDKNGSYKARATEALLIKSKDKGTPGIQVNFEVTEGDFAGQTVRWDGWLTEKTAERTLESLSYCGWTGDDISVFAEKGCPESLDGNIVEIVVELEPYQGTEEKYAGKSFPRVQWVNKLGGRGLSVDNAMARDEATAFAAKMKGLVHKTRAKQPAGAGSGTEFEFGANANSNKPAAKQF